MAKLTIKELERKTKYYFKWFIVTRDSNHGKNCALGTILYKDKKVPIILTPSTLMDACKKNFLTVIPLDCVSVDIHMITPDEFRCEYQHLVNFLLSCNPKQLQYVTKKWSAQTLSDYDVVEEMIDNIIWPYLNR